MRVSVASMAVAALLSATLSHAHAQQAERKADNIKIKTEVADVSAGGCVDGHCSGEGAVSNKVCRPPDAGYEIIPGTEEIHHTIRKDDHGTISPKTAVTILGDVTRDQICIIATAWPVAAEHRAHAAGYATVWEKPKR